MDLIIKGIWNVFLLCFNKPREEAAFTYYPYRLLVKKFMWKIYSSVYYLLASLKLEKKNYATTPFNRISACNRTNRKKIKSYWKQLSWHTTQSLLRILVQRVNDWSQVMRLGWRYVSAFVTLPWRSKLDFVHQLCIRDENSSH